MPNLTQQVCQHTDMGEGACYFCARPFVAIRKNAKPPKFDKFGSNISKVTIANDADASVLASLSN